VHHNDAVKSGSNCSAAKKWVAKLVDMPKHLQVHMLCQPFASMSKENFAERSQTIKLIPQGALTMVNGHSSS